MPKLVTVIVGSRRSRRYVGARARAALLGARGVPTELASRTVAAPLGPRRPQPTVPGYVPQTILLVYSGTTFDRVLFVDAGSPTDPVNVIALVLTGAKIGSTSAASPALSTGTTWATGTQLYLENRGTIAGAGGAGGNGGGENVQGKAPTIVQGGGGGGGAGLTPGAGGLNDDAPGGTAQNGQPGTETVGGAGGLGDRTTAGTLPQDGANGQSGGAPIGLGWPIRIYNRFGTIRGGGGGGAGGTARSFYSDEEDAFGGGGVGEGSRGHPDTHPAFAGNPTYRNGARGGPLFAVQASPDPAVTFEQEGSGGLGSIVVGGPRRVELLSAIVGSTLFSLFIKDELDFDPATLQVGWDDVDFFGDDFYQTEYGTVFVANGGANLANWPDASLSITGSRVAGYTVTFTSAFAVGAWLSVAGGESLRPILIVSAGNLLGTNAPTRTYPRAPAPMPIGFIPNDDRAGVVRHFLLT